MTDFIVVGNKNAIMWKDIFPHYYNRELFFGYSIISRFRLPDGSYNWYQGTGRWFTTIPTDKHNPPLQLVPYDPERHRTYDTYPAVNTDSIYDIPDIEGEIGVPMGIIDYINDDQFTITGYLNNGSGGVYDKGKPLIGGRSKYRRVLVILNNEKR